MPRPATPFRLPLANDLIRSSSDAIAVVSMAIHRPLEAETIAFFLDECSRSNTITVVSGTTDPDSVLLIAECMGAVATRSPTLCGLVLATVRPQSPATLSAHHSAQLPGDVNRWVEANEITEAHGIELIEWFIIGPGGVDCPRDVVGEPERW
jgi:hypothetical protein